MVEAFVRHHAHFVDRHIFLDNGSSDATVDILHALKGEGFRLTLYRGDAAAFMQTDQNTFLLRQAVSLSADWVLYLDTDEFIDDRGLDGPLHAHLGKIPREFQCAKLSLVDYQADPRDDTGEMIVPKRITRRRGEISDVLKVFVRNSVALKGGVVDAGNHAVIVDGREAPAFREHSVQLAHFPMRSGWQMLAKAVIGRLKVLAAGSQEISRNRSVHYTGLFDHLRDHPEWLLRNEIFLGGFLAPDEAAALIDDPIAYRGGDLRHTRPNDPPLRAVQSLIAYAEELARGHGQMIDRNGGAAMAAAHSIGEITQVF